MINDEHELCSNEDDELQPAIECPDCGRTIYPEETDGGDSGHEPICICYRCSCGFREYL